MLEGIKRFLLVHFAELQRRGEEVKQPSDNKFLFLTLSDSDANLKVRFTKLYFHRYLHCSLRLSIYSRHHS